MACDPAAGAVVVRVAMPLASTGTVPRADAPSAKSTEPVGALGPAATTASKVTGWPATVDGLDDTMATASTGAATWIVPLSAGAAADSQRRVNDASSSVTVPRPSALMLRITKSPKSWLQPRPFPGPSMPGWPAVRNDARWASVVAAGMELVAQRRGELDRPVVGPGGLPDREVSGRTTDGVGGGAPVAGRCRPPTQSPAGQSGCWRQPDSVPPPAPAACRRGSTSTSHSSMRAATDSQPGSSISQWLWPSTSRRRPP